MAKTYDYLFKLLLIGDSGVGKTSLLFRKRRAMSSAVTHPTSRYLLINYVGVSEAPCKNTCEKGQSFRQD